MEVEVRRFLSAIDPVVLERQYSKRPVGPDERLCDSLGRDQDSAALRFGEIEQRRDVPTRDDAALTHFELPWIEHGQGVFAFVYDRPSRCAAGHPFTEVARVSYGKLDHVPRPVNWLPLDGYLHDCRWLVTRRISSR